MKCPGQDSRYWKQDAIFETKCPECGTPVEFFKDDTARKCIRCGHRFMNPGMDFGCAAYCEFAEQCIGTLPPELVAEKESLFKDRVAIEMKKYFKADFKRIGHAMRVARYAESICKKVSGNMPVILSAAYLHDIGIHEAERKHGDSGSERHEEFGPEIARKILTGVKAKPELIDEICEIVGHHHHPKENETLNFKVVYDADLITNLEEQQKESLIDSKKLNNIIENKFLTDAGREVATSVLQK
ncbi:MAG: HD domain-containing protein [Desulfobacterales bacterium]|nr:HD domain-containing protein [Desulfobacterales bacterium]